MSDIAVRVENLGKEYHIAAVQKERYRTLRDYVSRSAAAPFRRAYKLIKGQATGAAELDETIWALRDVSFEVPRGEVLGIIGHNGAGKSTLLKVLSRITEPSTGFAEIHGRVGSLLEVGTGFHPELTGRENVFLNGAILGMTRREIVNRFDEIVDFSGVERFIDTPVKHFSSGMALRLAFAVAAHLDPEILIVDEVLAVGDAAFQRKCLGKMGEVADAGRTVLLVSHNMGAVNQLCQRALHLSGGRLVDDGDSGAVIARYLGGDDLGSSWTRSSEGDGGSSHPDRMIRSIRVLNEENEEAAVVPYEEAVRLEIVFEISEEQRDLTMVMAVLDDRGRAVVESWDTDGTELAGATRTVGAHVSTCTVPSRLLKPGRYYVNVVAHVPGVRIIERQLRAVAFEVSPVGYPFKSERFGAVAPMLRWDTSAPTGEPRILR